MSNLFLMVTISLVIISAYENDDEYEIGVIDNDPQIIEVKDSRTFSFMAYLVEAYEFSLFCNGAIIHAQWVLTSAKCVTDIYIEDIIQILSRKFYVAAGTTDATLLRSSHQVRDANAVFVHDRFDYESGKYDIALVQTEKPFSFDVQVTPIQFSSNELFADWPASTFYKSCTLLAYGLGAITKSSSPFKLMQMELELIDEDDCEQIQEYFKDIQMDFLICAKNSKLYNWESLYTGGGAMLLCGRNSLELCGILLGKGNYDDTDIVINHKEQPELFTRVFKHESWIKQIIKYDTCSVIDSRAISEATNAVLNINFNLIVLLVLLLLQETHYVIEL